ARTHQLRRAGAFLKAAGPRRAGATAGHRYSFSSGVAAQPPRGAAGPLVTACHRPAAPALPGRSLGGGTAVDRQGGPGILAPSADDHPRAPPRPPPRPPPPLPMPVPPRDHHGLRRQAPGHWPNLTLLPATPITTPRGLTLTDRTVSPSGSAGICRMRSRIGASSAAGTPV